jgi:CspA family cold shock protein
MPKKPKLSEQGSAATGVVKWYSEDEGWGVIQAPVLPGDCFVHFSNIEEPGYRALRAGQQVRFTYERPGFLQDGCPFRALKVWPEESKKGGSR